MRASRGVWMAAKSGYVEGGPDAGSWPTLEQVAQEHGIAFNTLAQRAARERWNAERQLFIARVERERRNTKLVKLAGEAAEVDGAALKLAKALLGEVATGLRDLGRARALRDRQIEAAGGDEAAYRLLIQHCRPSVSALTVLAQTLLTAQRVARTALGEVSDHQQVDLAGTVEVAHDLRADPVAVAAVARILRDAGLPEEDRDEPYGGKKPVVN